MFRPTASVWTQDKIKEALAGGAQSVTVSKQEMWKTVLWFTVMRLWPMKSSQHSCSFSHGARQEEKDGPRIAIEVTIKQGCLEPQCFQCRKPSDRNPKDKGCAGSNGYHDRIWQTCFLFLPSQPSQTRQELTRISRSIPKSVRRVCYIFIYFQHANLGLHLELLPGYRGKSWMKYLGMISITIIVVSCKGSIAKEPHPQGSNFWVAVCQVFNQFGTSD